ncbi:MAG: hypothetical protein JNJ58_12635 [Chitinophagaceae bacterium]|nr:hypothetical protein [Chitinophagaceae bacterium]
MPEQQEPIEQLREIRNMMERSSRFVSLSGWSGITAGLAGLLGAFLAHRRIGHYYDVEYGQANASPEKLYNDLLLIAVGIFILAFVLAIFFTWRKSRHSDLPFWGEVSKRLLMNTMLPMLAGGIFILRLMEFNQYDFVAPACLIFYGLGLINGSKYTLGEVRYLGMAQLFLGLMNLFFMRDGLWFWAAGFGLMHIVYGTAMWWKYERKA